MLSFMNRTLKILVIDNNRDVVSFGSKDLVHWVLKNAPLGSSVMVRRGPHSDLPPIHEHFDALVISGSSTSCVASGESWIQPYDDYVAEHMKKSTPILGVCYGHQTIARILFRMNGQEPKMGKLPHAEHGWGPVSIVDETELFEGLSGPFYTYHSHYEGVYEVPPGANVFAESEHCKVQGFEVTGKPIFGVQFHPEYNIEYGERILKEKIAKKVNPDWILNPGKGSQLYNENVGKAIFGNFFRIASKL